MHWPGVRWPIGEQADEARREVGRRLDAAGWDPIEGPARIVHTSSLVTLKVSCTAPVTTGSTGPG